MKKLLLLLLCVPLIGFGQLTIIPDANFEQRLISFGYDNILDGTVLTAAIDTVTQLQVGYYGISDLTGIEDFTALTYLNCGANQLTSIDESARAEFMTIIDKLPLAYNDVSAIYRSVEKKSPGNPVSLAPTTPGSLTSTTTANTPSKHSQIMSLPRTHSSASVSPTSPSTMPPTLSSTSRSTISRFMQERAISSDDPS